MSNNNKKRGLGRGLSALLENAETDITTGDNKEQPKVAGSVAAIPIHQVEENPFQPRSHFEPEALAELAASIKEHGIIQPITVRKLGYDKYQLISGERRLRASKAAGLKEIPAYIRIANDQGMLEMALVENIQRENLDSIEVAISFKRLMEECDLTQDALSVKVGKKRTTVTNYLRLLKLPAEIQVALRENKLSMGHARALINIDDPKQQLDIFHRIVRSDLSVRKAEDMVRAFMNPEPKAEKPEFSQLSFVHQKYQEDLSYGLGTSVELKPGKAGSGKIVINFKTEEELERIMELMNSTM